MSEVTIILNDERKRNELLELVAQLPYVAAVRLAEDPQDAVNGARKQPLPSNGTPPPADPLDREVAFFEEQHDHLVEKFLGQYIAMYQGQVIGHHTDLESLITNVYKTHTNTPILFRQVRETLPPTLFFRSPRMVTR